MSCTPIVTLPPTRIAGLQTHTPDGKTSSAPQRLSSYSSQSLPSYHHHLISTPSLHTTLTYACTMYNVHRTPSPGVFFSLEGCISIYDHTTQYCLMQYNIFRGKSGVMALEDGGGLNFVALLCGAAGIEERCKMGWWARGMGPFGLLGGVSWGMSWFGYIFLRVRGLGLAFLIHTPRWPWLICDVGLMWLCEVGWTLLGVLGSFTAGNSAAPKAASQGGMKSST
ncbi:hypothetical protein BDU57DRAFT_517375 [Ampelomyces quisqualis]|uniref:Uncharacterized protein n=1 Tax=Ampelomyces quisqualis TaxID=50730 RepID=A0A6A5QMR7_AMPQU|nr:hypothetical protein BDU57DRAFT_517375 [Ampelomyces quisqualis]